jgi:uncharacterized protein (TIGR03792 family)
MVIERLEVDVDQADHEAFLAQDRMVWTSFLAGQPGFRHKEVWVEPSNPNVLIIHVWWDSRELWGQITEAQCVEVDARMGRWFREARMREFVVM